MVKYSKEQMLFTSIKGFTVRVFWGRITHFIIGDKGCIAYISVIARKPLKRQSTISQKFTLANNVLYDSTPHYLPGPLFFYALEFGFVQQQL